ncbi:MAG: NAD-dependent succinate-semialdehyde dehydrogenase [Acidimicrobiia bacterium]
MAIDLAGLNEDTRAVLANTPTRAFLGGEWFEAKRRMPVENPATAAVIGEVSDVEPSEFETALGVADAFQEEFAGLATRQRAEILRRTFDLLMARQEELAHIITLEMGKPLAESRSEVAYAAEFFRWFSEEAVRFGGDYRQSPAGNGRILVMHKPVGPSLFITPWNFPIAMGARKIAPAFAAGCTSIVKPASATPLTMLALAKIMEEAGAPVGSLSVLPTSQASATTTPLIHDPRLRKLSFTGSTAVGRGLLAEASSQVLRVSMELGGNAPFVVFDDANLSAAVEGAMVAKLRNGGEACTSANRFLVHEAVVDEFIDRLSAAMAAVQVGSGFEDGVELGPLIDHEAQSRVSEWMAEAQHDGATLHLGGRSLPGPGWFFEPTVISNVGADTKLNRDEIFAPVAAIRTFANEDEAIEMANDTEYGLIAYVYTEGLRRGLRVCEAIEAGMVGLNRGVISDPAAPFGGIKQSGLGREGGFQGIYEYLETKYIGVA